MSGAARGLTLLAEVFGLLRRAKEADDRANAELTSAAEGSADPAVDASAARSSAVGAALDEAARLHATGRDEFEECLRSIHAACLRGRVSARGPLYDEQGNEIGDHARPLRAIDRDADPHYAPDLKEPWRSGREMTTTGHLEGEAISRSGSAGEWRLLPQVVPGHREGPRMSGVGVYPVTDDPDIARQIIEKMDVAAEHFEVEALAHSLGLFPPGWQEGGQTTVGLCRPPGSDPVNDEGIPVWGVDGLPEQGE